MQSVLSQITGYAAHLSALPRRSREPWREELRQLREEWTYLADQWKRYNPNQPRVPAGHPDGGQWTRVGGNGGSTMLRGGSGNDRLTAKPNWGKAETLEEHFIKHAADFGSTSMEEYAAEAEAFRQRAMAQKLPAVEHSNGKIAIYDPTTRTFGVYNANGTTATFYKPTSPTYFERVTQDVLANGGRVLRAPETMPGDSVPRGNPLPSPSSSPSPFHDFLDRENGEKRRRAVMERKYIRY